MHKKLIVAWLLRLFGHVVPAPITITRDVQRIIFPRQPYTDEMEANKRQAFLGHASILYKDPTLLSIINRITAMSYDKAALETRTWEETLAARAHALGSVEVLNELERLSVEYESLIQHQSFDENDPIGQSKSTITNSNKSEKVF